MEGYTHDTEFENRTFTAERLPEGDYDNCTFRGCDFSNGFLDGIRFMECRFVNCNLTMTKLGGTVLSSVKFSGCKMLGVRLDECNPNGLTPEFDNCLLDHASFLNVKMRKTIFRDCRFREADFSGADLSLSLFDKCDFSRALFSGTKLEGADLHTSLNYTIAPDENTLKGAKFSLDGLPGLLAKYKIEVI